ncbi:putative MFS transporter [Aspergillus saccharolyticus JOP 1030-1]|uniref:MFS transporter n=1 Tax=Aspergillus saccharolyticus JOP 1030-1 TaxID=1450539 RepID=A0A318ZNL1_9EURO|nr:MFS transporter [Aspergillus saccharolyticus JOP 1030-1]PYH41678.1 MFS transporter [Aspergillus saccharolyticus JOP 1030-1]
MVTQFDPKLYPRRVRYAALLTVNVFVFMGNMYSSGIATGFESLAMDLHVSYQKLADLISWSVLSMGLANLFWMPLALTFGKRPIVLISMAMFVAGIIWTVVAKDYNSLMGARVFASFGYGSIESLGPSILADMFYERNYSSAMAMYALFLSAGSQVGPMIAGYLVAARGWRWFFIVCLIVAAVNLVTTFFFLPETMYESDREEEQDDEMQGKNEVIHSHIESLPTSATRQAREAQPFSYNEYWKGLFRLGISTEARQKGVLRFLGYAAWLPIPMLLLPGVLLASMMYGVVLGAVVSISTLSSSIFSAPPYLFSSGALGLWTLGSFIGIIVVAPLAGPLTDALSQYLRRRNNGIHKPEHRLPALIVPFCIAPVGLVVFGYTTAHAMHYALPALGSAMAAAGLTLVPSVMLSYVVDSYPHASGEALVLVNVSKNVVAFGLSKGSVDWMMRQGLARMFYEFAGIQWAVLALGAPLFFLGPWLRKRTARYF